MDFPRPQNLHFIINPASGQSQPLLFRINRKMRDYGIPWDLRVTHGMGDGARLAREAVDAGADAIAVYGGDGTVMDVAAGLIGRKDIPLLILSGGTGNLVAAEVGVPKDLDRALGRLNRDQLKTRTVDVGRVGTHPFLLRAGCGIETGVLQDATPDMKRQFGKWAYIFAAANALQEVRTAEYRITLDDDRVITGTGVGCAVANAGTVGVAELTLSPRIGIDDGKLDVVFLRKADVEGIFSLVAMMMGLDGQKSHPPAGDPAVDASHLVSRWQAEKVRIETDPVLDMQVDGDLVFQTPQTIEIMPHALRVIV